VPRDGKSRTVDGAKSFFRQVTQVLRSTLSFDLGTKGFTRSLPLLSLFLSCKNEHIDFLLKTDFIPRTTLPAISVWVLTSCLSRDELPFLGFSGSAKRKSGVLSRKWGVAGFKVYTIKLVPHIQHCGLVGLGTLFSIIDAKLLVRWKS